MKRFSLFSFTAFASLSVAILFSACSSSRSGQIALPDDTKMMVKIEPEKIAEHLELSRAQLTNATSEEGADFILSMLDSKQPIYISSNTSGYMIISGEVATKSDAKRLEAELIEQGDGSKPLDDGYTLINMDRGSAVVHKGKYFALIGQADMLGELYVGIAASDDIEQYARNLIAGKYGDYSQSDLYRDAHKSKAELVASIEPFTASQFSGYSREILFSMDIEKEKITFAVEQDGESANADMFDEISGEFDKFLPAEFIAHVALALDVEQEDLDVILKQFESFPSGYPVDVKGMVKAAEGVAPIIASIDGDVVLSVSNGTPFPEVALLAEVNNSLAVEQLLALAKQNGIAVTNDGADRYVVNTPFVVVYFGIHKDNFYFTNSDNVRQALLKNKRVDENFASTKFAKEIDGNCTAMLLDVKNLCAFPMVAQQISSMPIPMLSDVEMIKSIARDEDYGEIVIEFTPGSSSALSRIVDALLVAM